MLAIASAAACGSLTSHFPQARMFAYMLAESVPEQNRRVLALSSSPGAAVT